MRVDLYWDVHKGLRYELFDRVNQLGRLDVDDDGALSGFTNALNGTVELLTVHAAHEEECVHPLLRAQYGELLTELEQDHAMLDRKMDAARRAVETIATVPREERAAAAVDAYQALSAFTGAYVTHMAREEREAMTALWGLFDDGRLLEVQTQIRGSVPPETMAQFLRCMLPALNVDERSTMLSGMKANAPPEAFAGVCDLAQGLLSESEWRAVQQRVGL